MAQVDQITVLIRGEDQLSKPVAVATRSLAHFNTSAQATDKAAGSATSAVSRMAAAFGKFAAIGAGIGVATAGIAALARGASGLGKAFIGTNITMENTRAQLVAMTKDGKQADKILEEIRKEADKTPFAFEEMAAAAAGLMPAAKQSGVALMDLVRQAEILAASNPAEGLEGAAFALREALSGDFTSVIERFNLPRQRINELKAQGVPALKAISTAMKEMGLDASLVAARAETLEGRWSTFLDTISGITRIIGQPLFEELKRGLMSLQTFLDANKETIDGWARTAGKAIGDFVATAVPAVVNFAKSVLPTLVTAFGQVRDALGQVKDALVPVTERIQTFVGSMLASQTLATAVNKAFGDLIPPELNKTLDAVDQAFKDVTTEVIVLSAILRDAGIAEGIREIGRAAAANLPQTARQMQVVAEQSEYADEKFRHLVQTVTQGSDQMGMKFGFLTTVIDTAVGTWTALWAAWFAFVGYSFERLDVYIRGFRIGIQAIGDTTEAIARRIIAAWQSVEKALGPIFQRLTATMPTAAGFKQSIGVETPPADVKPGTGGGGSVGAFQHGGSFLVGGSGGPDSQMVAFRATPGERVTVQTPQQQRAGATITIGAIHVHDEADEDRLVAKLETLLTDGLRAARSSGQRFPLGLAPGAV